MTPSLPLEVAEVVIDHLRDSKPDLHACCLVCRDWTHRSRFHIFRDVQIGHQDRLYSLSALLASQPALRPLVHSVTYSLNAPTKHQVVPVSLLTQLPNVRAWAFTGSPSGDRPMDFNRQSLSVFRKCAISIRELHISNATFSSCADFGRVLLAFTNIRALTCATLQFAKRGTLDVVKTRLSKGSFLCSLTSWKMQEASTWLLLELGSGTPLQYLTVDLKGARKRESTQMRVGKTKRR
ncbi:hypothetical protein LXA43DRAFT_136315 [Ganoderma leucocontextum]|nr:hypothetical protein LXA43DRAFT_136315 [Ganoderma leucocontextum]